MDESTNSCSAEGQHNQGLGDVILRALGSPERLHCSENT